MNRQDRLEVASLSVCLKGRRRRAVTFHCGNDPRHASVPAFGKRESPEKIANHPVSLLPGDQPPFLQRFIRDRAIRPRDAQYLHFLRSYRYCNRLMNPVRLMEHGIAERFLHCQVREVECPNGKRTVGHLRDILTETVVPDECKRINKLPVQRAPENLSTMPIPVGSGLSTTSI